MSIARSKRQCRSALFPYMLIGRFPLLYTRNMIETKRVKKARTKAGNLFANGKKRKRHEKCRLVAWVPFNENNFQRKQQRENNKTENRLGILIYMRSTAAAGTCSCMKKRTDFFCCLHNLFSTNFTFYFSLICLEHLFSFAFCCYYCFTLHYSCPNQFSPLNVAERKHTLNLSVIIVML